MFTQFILAALVLASPVLWFFETYVFRTEELELTTGTVAAVRNPFFQDMPWAQWNKVYYRTQADQGVILLIVEKVDSNNRTDARWVGVDPTGRVQMHNLRQDV